MHLPCFGWICVFVEPVWQHSELACVPSEWLKDLKNLGWLQLSSRPLDCSTRRYWFQYAGSQVENFRWPAAAWRESDFMFSYFYTLGEYCNLFCKGQPLESNQNAQF
jgi:hypothetical protein